MKEEEIDIGKQNNFSNKKTIKIPFVMLGNLIIVKVKLNNKKRRFLFDSGSPKIILNAKHISKKNKEENMVIASAHGTGGEISKIHNSKINSLNFGGIVVENQDVFALDISHLEKALKPNFKIHGLIGYELFKEYDLMFDYKNKILTLIQQQFYPKYKKKLLAKHDLSIIPFDLINHVPIIKATIGKKEYSFGIDSGAEINLINNELLTDLAKYFKHKDTTILSGADKNKVKVNKGVITKTIIGKTFKKMKTILNDISHLNNGYNLNLDGLMGYELLSKQKTLISYSKKELVFID